MNYLVRMFLVATLSVSAFMPIGSHANQIDPCIPQFASFGNISDETNIQSILSTKVRGSFVAAYAQLKDKLSDDVGNAFLNTTIVSDATLAASDAVVASMKEELSKLGYIVRIVKRPFATYQAGVNISEIPERDVLLISAGVAKGKFARELRRFEKDTAARRRDPQLPIAVREKEFGVSIDPLISLALGARGHYSASHSYGYGAALSPSIFADREEVVVEILRHELRHQKSYFDRVAGKPTVNRASISGYTTVTLDPNTIYAKGFPVEELDAFASNVVSAQADLGKHTELMRKAMASSTPPTTAEVDAFKRDIESIKARGVQYANRIIELNKATLGQLTLARARLADPLLSAREFEKRISTFTDDMNQGLRRAHIRLDENRTSSGAVLRIWMPDDVTKKGTEAMREYAIQYCNELEKHTIEVEKKNLERLKDISRDPMSRLEPPTK